MAKKCARVREYILTFEFGRKKKSIKNKQKNLRDAIKSATSAAFIRHAIVSFVGHLLRKVLHFYHPSIKINDFLKKSFSIVFDLLTITWIGSRKWTEMVGGSIVLFLQYVCFLHQSQVLTSRRDIVEFSRNSSSSLTLRTHECTKSQ